MSTTRLRETGRRGTPTQRLVAVRRWLLSGFALLAVVLASLVAYEHHRARHLLTELPHRLGVDIQSETNGFTYTQSVKGRVLFTVHAAKAIQRENGKTTLHDVSIAVHPTPGSDRPDTIRGEQFEYDQVNGVIRAAGVVHLDLAGPKARSADPHAAAARIAVTTSGLVFLQKLGVLATDEPLQLVYGDMHGSAHGADYETDTGMLHLRSDVQLDGTEDGKPVHLVATAAEFDRTQQMATLHSAQVQVAADRARGDRMVLTTTSGSGPRVLDAEGHVIMDDSNGEHLSAHHVRANMNEAGQLQQVAAQGDVQLQDDRYRATAGNALLRMDAAGHPHQAELTTAVHVSVSGKPGQASSELTAPHTIFNLVESGSHTDLKDISADGGAVLSSAEAGNTDPLQPKKSRASQVSTLTARALHAITAVADGTRYIATVDGQGSTRLEQTDSLGNRQVSSGDTLRAVLLPSAPAGATSGTQALLRSVVQTGHVDVSQHKVLPPAQGSRAAAPRVEDDHATAQQAEWDNVSEQLRLTGSPVLTGPGVQLAADTIDLSQKTSSTDATGHLQGTLERVGTSNSEPVHVLAERGHIDSVTGTAQFIGQISPVRLWTSSAQLEAAQVDVKKVEGVLIAHSAGLGAPSDVRLLLNEESNNPANKAKQHGTVLVHGQQMTITAANAQTSTRVETTGQARVTTGGSDVRADRVVALMNPSRAPGAQQPAQPTAGASLLPGGGSLQSIAASGNVRLQQPGRSARGQDLLYTAKDDQYRLSGQHEAPAFLHDSLRGDVTGASLIFHGDTERAEVAGETSHPVRTELPAPLKPSH